MRGQKVLNLNLSINYNGNVFSPMILPTQDSDSFNDPRPSESPWWSLQSLQLIKNFEGNYEFYFGVKNLLDWTPWKNLNTSYLGNTKDPFIRNTPSDILIFDPSYLFQVLRNNQLNHLLQKGYLI